MPRQDDSSKSSSKASSSWRKHKRVSKSDSTVISQKPCNDEKRQEGLGIDVSNSTTRVLHNATSATFKALSKTVRSTNKMFHAAPEEEDLSKDKTMYEHNSYGRGFSSLRHRSSQTLKRYLHLVGKKINFKKLVASPDPSDAVENQPRLDVAIPHYALLVPGQKTEDSPEDNPAGRRLLSLFDGPSNLQQATSKIVVRLEHQSRNEEHNATSMNPTSVHDNENDLKSAGLPVRASDHISHTGRKEFDSVGTILADSTRSNESGFFKAHSTRPWPPAGVSPFRRSKSDELAVAIGCSALSDGTNQSLPRDQNIHQTEHEMRTLSIVDKKPQEKEYHCYYYQPNAVGLSHKDEESGVGDPRVSTIVPRPEWNERRTDRQRRYDAVHALRPERSHSLPIVRPLFVEKGGESCSNASKSIQSAMYNSCPPSTGILYHTLYHELHAVGRRIGDNLAPSTLGASETLPEVRSLCNVNEIPWEEAQSSQVSRFPNPARPETSSPSPALSYPDRTIRKCTSSQANNSKHNQEPETASQITEQAEVVKSVTEIPTILVTDTTMTVSQDPLPTIQSRISAAPPEHSSSTTRKASMKEEHEHDQSTTPHVHPSCELNKEEVRYAAD